MNLFLQKNRDKRNNYQSTFAQSEKDYVKRKWKEKNESIEKTHSVF